MSGRISDERLAETHRDQLAAMARGHCLTAEMSRVHWAFNNIDWGRATPYWQLANYVETTFGVFISRGRLDSLLSAHGEKP